MRYLVLSLILTLFVVPSPVLAQTPTPAPTPGPGYNFQPYDFENGNAIDLSNQLNVFNQPGFINPAGSTAVTMWNMVNATNAIGIFVVLLLGLRVVWWLYGNVTSSKPPTSKLSDVTDDLQYISRKNPFRVISTNDDNVYIVKKRK